MKYNELKLTKAKKAKRAGRGISAGRGKTAGRGTKGQGARKSGGVRPGFEGGQMPLYMRLPKLRGFKSLRQPAETVYTGQLEAIKKTVITASELADEGLVSSKYALVKLIQKGELSSAKNVKLPLASAGAIKTLETAGGSFTKTARLQREKAKKAEP